MQTARCSHGKQKVRTLSDRMTFEEQRVSPVEADVSVLSFDRIIVQGIFFIQQIVFHCLKFIQSKFCPLELNHQNSA